MTASRRRGARLVERVDALGTAQTILVAVSLGLLVAGADLRTGQEISFSVFYVAPIGLVAWRLGRVAALVAAVLAAAAWFAVEIVGGREYSQPLIPVWNAIVRLAYFGIIAALLVTLRDALGERSAQARTDTLTGVLNRRGFAERAHIEFDRAMRSQLPVTIAALDIDHFKLLNDSAGHAAGDNALLQVGQTMRAALRDIDVIARLGGDEFAVLLPEMSGADARRVFDRLHNQLRAATTGIGIGFSLGVVTFDRPPHDIDVALERADALMYAAKADPAGGIRYGVEPGATAWAHERS
jgi:diguanylate cyclase (GGDEF)-like protein